MEASPTTISNESINITEQKHKIEYIVVEGMAPRASSPVMRYYGLPFIVDRVNKMLNEGWELQGGVSDSGDRIFIQAMIKKY